MWNRTYRGKANTKWLLANAKWYLILNWPLPQGTHIMCYVKNVFEIWRSRAPLHGVDKLHAFLEGVIYFVVKILLTDVDNGGRVVVGSGCEC